MTTFLSLLVIFAISFGYLNFVKGDTPANCSFEDVSGSWKFTVGPISNIIPFSCTPFPKTSVKYFKLIYPNLVVDELGHTGTWTMIYNQGFEITIDYRKYFAFSDYSGNGDNVVSICNQTRPGLTHDIHIRQWACFNAQKINLENEHHSQKPKITKLEESSYLDRNYIPDSEFVDKINSIQNSWTATNYPEFNHMTLRDIRLRSGISGRLPINKSPQNLKSKDIAKKISSLPQSFDWRNVNNVNYVSPVRNQGSCGSCYAFASAAQLEARIAILSNNSIKPVLSPQDIVECSSYSQGCDGGFPFLIAGKYAQDFGMVEETCNPYLGKDGVCKTSSDCKRYYSTNHHYIGGYYGACTEELMLLELVEKGPFAVGFEVYPDFKFYKNGIYVHTGLIEKYNPFEITNHAVLVVGYGVDYRSNQKYWIVKNSWGDKWGVDGYFMIKRGSDECSIESIGVSIDAVL